MPSPPAPPLWTLNASGLTGPVGGNQSKLAGCHIAQSATGTYTFYKPSWDSLATFSGTPLSCSFNYNGVDGWTVTLATAVSGSNATGGWGTPATLENTPAESGSYTAQTGGGPLAVEEDEAASSAKA